MNAGDEQPPRISPPPHIRQQPQQYKFTPDEIRVIKECNRESFYQRCLPLGAFLGLTTYYAIKSGYLKTNNRFGAFPKVSVAVVTGYFVGKLSYQSKCAEKLMQLPNSPLAEILRRRRQGALHESVDSGFGPGMSLAPFSNISPSDTYSDSGPGVGDMDTTRPQFDGLDDSHRPSVDNPIYEEEMPPVQKHVTTYDELRKKNREEYMQKRLGKSGGEMKYIPPPVAPSTPTDERPATGGGGHRNQYGDLIE